jgi:hypothetical protein
MRGLTSIQSSPPRPAAQRWNGDRADTPGTNQLHQRGQAGLDVFDAALATPVALGWKVDDVARRGELPRLEHEHPARLHLTAPASRGIGPEVLRVGMPELQRDATPHHSHTVDRIDERIRPGLQDVAAGVFDHG